MLPLRRIWSLFDARERPRAVLLVIGIFVAAGLETLGVGLIMPFIQLIEGPAAVEHSRFLVYLRGLLGLESRDSLLIGFGLLLLGFFLAKNLYLGVLLLLSNRFVYGKMFRLSEQMFEAYLRAPYAMHLQRNSAELQRNVNKDTGEMFKWVVAQSFQLIGDGLVALVLTAMLLWINPVATFAAVLLLGGVTFVFFRLIRRRAHMLGKVEQQSFGEMIKWVTQALTGIKETKVTGTERFFVDTFAVHSRRFSRARRILSTINDLPPLFFETAAVVGMLTVVVVLILAGKLDTAIATIAVFAMAAFRLMPSMARIIRSSNLIKHFRPSFDVVFQDLAYVREFAQQSHNPTEVEPWSLEDHIRFESLGFRYTDDGPMVLDDVDLVIRKNQSVAFAGPSGAGKTTLVDLMLGLLPPTTGRILADGADIAENLAAWQRNIGYVPQSIHLIDDSIRRNVAFGCPDARIDDELVWRALADAELDEFVRGLPAGLDTSVGESGVRMSGGQRQRIGIARALYRDPGILVLDEATSSLDRETESAIAETVSSLRGHKTVISIAHRLKTIESCDPIFYFEGGRLTASGTYPELVESCPGFRRMAGISVAETTEVGGL